jgi:putative transposase
MDTELAVNILLMALWPRQPQSTVLVHSDQDSQFSSYDWQAILKVHNLQTSMSRRGDCHENAAAESFLQLLKRERIRRKSSQPAPKQDKMCLITSRYFITLRAATA